MAGTQVQRRRGTTAEHATFTGAVGELTVDLDKKTVVVHDGETPGGNPLPTQFSPSFKGDTAVERDLAVGRDVGVVGGLVVGGDTAVGGALTVAGSPVVTEDSFPVDTVVGKDSPTGAALLPGGSAAERPTTPASGMLRFNADAEEFERYVDGEWRGLNQVHKAFQEAPVVSLASASTVNIGAASANTIQITGTNPILAFDSADSGNIRRVVFSGALALTHNATSLILPTGASIVTAAGDSAEFVSLGGGNWRCLRYDRASGRALVGGALLKEYVSAEQTLTAGGALTLAHGLGVKPKLVAAAFICKTADAGYSPGDEFHDALTYAYTDAGFPVTTTASYDTSDIRILFENAVGAIRIKHKSTGAITDMVLANWRLIVRAWA